MLAKLALTTRAPSPSCLSLRGSWDHPCRSSHLGQNALRSESSSEDWCPARTKEISVLAGGREGNELAKSCLEGSQHPSLLLPPSRWKQCEPWRHNNVTRPTEREWPSTPILLTKEPWSPINSLSRWDLAAFYTCSVKAIFIFNFHIFFLVFWEKVLLRGPG